MKRMGKSIFLRVILLFSLPFGIVLQSCGGGGDGGAVVTPAVTIQMGGSLQGAPLSLSGATATVAGKSLVGGVDAAGTAARFNGPYGIATDGTNLFVAERTNHTIRKVVIATGAVTTLAGSAGLSGSADGIGSAARFNGPYDIETDGTNLYVADTFNNTIRKVVIATGAVTTLAGSAGLTGTTDGTGAAARFNRPSGITRIGAILYVSDALNHTIRQVSAGTGTVTTLAGFAGSAGSLDGAGPAARFDYPTGITTDETNLFVTDTSNHTIRKVVIATAVVTTLAGTADSSGSADGTGAAARFNLPFGITTDGTNLYVADTYNQTIREIVIATGVVTTLAGSPWYTGSVDAAGSAARFDHPFGLTANGTNLFVADSLNHTIRRVAIATAEVTTLAGSGDSAGSADATGSGARFAYPWGVTTDGTNLYVADASNNTIRQVAIATGAVTTLAGTAGTVGTEDGTGSAARFDLPAGITTDGTNLFVAERSNHTIRKIVIATGVVTTLAGTADSAGSADGTGAVARFNGPYGITTDGTNLYVTDTFNSTIRKVVIATAEVTTLAGSATLTGFADGAGAAARFDNPYALTTDGTSIFVADSMNHTIRKIVIATGVVSTLAGTATESGSVNGTGASARFDRPYGITSDGTSLFVADQGNHLIRKVSIASGAVTTPAGAADISGSADGTGSAARFFSPYGITTDGTDLFVADTSNNTIRRIR